MSDEVIDQIQKQIESEDKDGSGGPTPAPGQEPPPEEQAVDPEAYPPVDNTADDSTQESLTPELDANVIKY
jgi:hypothetical protein